MIKKIGYVLLTIIVAFTGTVICNLILGALYNVFP